MSNQEKKTFLSGYLTACREEERLKQEVVRWRSRAESITAQYGPRAGGGGGGRSLESTVASMDQLMERLIRQQAELVAQRNKIETAISDVPEPRLRELLRLRYVDGMTWEQISVHLHYSYMQVCRLHGKALDQMKM